MSCLHLKYTVLVIIIGSHEISVHNLEYLKEKKERKKKQQHHQIKMNQEKQL